MRCFPQERLKTIQCKKYKSQLRSKRKWPRILVKSFHKRFKILYRKESITSWTIQSQTKILKIQYGKQFYEFSLSDPQDFPQDLLQYGQP